MRKKKEDRYRSIAVVLYELEHGVHPADPPPPPPGPERKVKEPVQSRHDISPKVPDRCPSCSNLITASNRLLKCYGCYGPFCETCEGWFRPERQRGKRPLCEKCYEKDLKRREEERRKAEQRIQEEKRRKEEQKRLEEEAVRKQQEDEKQRRALEEFLYGMTTVGNAAKKQQFWAQRLKADTEIVSPGGIRFMLLPPGIFTMGEGSDTHQVKLTKPFYLGKYQVTQREWEKVMGSNPSHFKGDDLPVDSVSWEDCQEFIRKLNALEGTDKYRLPTEAEWEYACRAGSSNMYCFGDDENKLKEYAWFYGNSGSKTHPVGKLKPNAWELHDMHGNVWEWCEDWYGGYPKSETTNPMGPSTGSRRVVRGGSWLNSAEFCRSAYRGWGVPGYRFCSLGFRLLRSL